VSEVIQDRAAFDIIRYANCWEDTDVLLEGLAVKKGGTYLSIASAGDNSLSLLTGDPSLVLAVDLSPAQMACTEIRKAVFSDLPHDRVLAFLGVKEDPDRMGIYRKVRDRLSPGARCFWDAHPRLIARGIIHVGKFENYFRLFRWFILPLVLNKKGVADLLREKTVEERKAFYSRRMDTWRWRALFNVFFSRTVMGRMGRDPEFFRYVEGDVARKILARTRHALTDLPTHNNPYVEYILAGNFGRALPHYLRPENFDKIRTNLNRLTLFTGSLAEAFQAYPGAVFDGFNLSDIFEYMSHQLYTEELSRVVRSSRKGARMVYWNMLATRHAPEALREIKPLSDLAGDLHRRDKAFFYKALVVEEVQ
jgi:S-adenosylmethionine-diacylglycerol 3-amino-3-carboxypropyl transferase